jgi:hypothetical protein
LYFNRMTDDGILALHISNKFVNLEPVVARIAAELGVEARVWRDDSESRPGKTASSWVALAKDAKTLGSLAAPTTDQILTFGTKNLEMIRMLEKYGPDKMAKESLMQEYGDDFLKIEVTPQGSKESGLALDDFIRRHGPQAGNMVEITRRYESAKEPIKLSMLARSIFGPMFHPLDLNPNMPLWTDDYSDVLRVMMLKEVIAVRKFFGLPTIKDDEE